MLQPKDTDWLNGYKNKTHICCLQKNHFRPKDTYRLKVRRWKNIFHALPGACILQVGFAACRCL